MAFWGRDNLSSDDRETATNHYFLLVSYFVQFLAKLLISIPSILHILVIIKIHETPFNAIYKTSQHKDRFKDTQEKSVRPTKTFSN